MKFKIHFINALAIIIIAMATISCEKEDKPVPFKVESITPVDGNRDIKFGQPITIVFSKKIKFVKTDFFVDYPINTDFTVTTTYDGDKTVTAIISKSSTVQFYKNREFYLGVLSVAADGDKLPIYPMNGEHEFYSHYWFSGNQ